MAPPKCHASTGSRLGVLNIRWGFRKIFETKVREALKQHTKDRKEAKRARRDSLSGRPTKRAKLDLEHRRRSNPSEDGCAFTSSKSSKRSGASKTKKTLQVRIGKRCQTVVSQKSQSPRKAGRHHRGSTSRAPSDRSGWRTNLASQGEVQITVPNEQDPMHAGPTEQRLAWEEPETLLRAEPTVCPRDAAAWAEVCPATDFETGQLMVGVGTPEEPLFMYTTGEDETTSSLSWAWIFLLRRDTISLGPPSQSSAQDKPLLRATSSPSCHAASCPEDGMAGDTPGPSSTAQLTRCPK